MNIAAKLLTLGELKAGDSFVFLGYKARCRAISVTHHEVMYSVKGNLLTSKNLSQTVLKLN